jgi:hypothetical protein
VQRSDFYRENSENCLRLAEAATNEPDQQRYKRMAAAWAALTIEQEWLDGQSSPSVKNRHPALLT